jgi:hypothetical protein
MAPSPSAKTDLLHRLRREIDRLQHRDHAGSPSCSLQHTAKDPVLSEAAPARRGGSPPPLSLDAEGLLYRQVFATGHRFGHETVESPSPELLGCVQTLLELETGNAATAPRPEEILFLDLETTGLSRAAGTLAFVIGLGRFVEAEGGLVVDQLLLRDPAAEGRVLELLAPYLEGARLLVSFNGRGFDLPVLRNRAVLCRASLALDTPHLDLLPPSRRLFRPRLSNCRLCTLERDLLGFERQGDVEGAEAPRIYADYLRTGRWDELTLVLEHNRLDVAILWVLLQRVSRHIADPLHWAEDGEELLSTGVLHLRRGDASVGEACLERGLALAGRTSTRRRLLAALARHHRREGRPEHAGALWEQHRREFPEHSAGWVELSKYHEHVTGDLGQALALAEEAPSSEGKEHERRLSRLRRRLQRVS